MKELNLMDTQIKHQVVSKFRLIKINMAILMKSEKVPLIIADLLPLPLEDTLS